MISIMLYRYSHFRCKESHPYCKYQRKKEAWRPEECEIVAGEIATKNNQWLKEHVRMHSRHYLHIEKTWITTNS